MSSPKNIQDELRSLESSLPFTNNQLFSVPEGYFEGLAASVLAKVKARESSASSELQELSPLLAVLSKKMPYSVPSFYFDENLKGGSGITSETESTILTSVGKDLPYSVPQGYFDNLPLELMAKVARPKAKVIPLFARTWMRVASAAIIGGALFIAGNNYFNNKEEDSIATGPRDTTKPFVANSTPLIEQEIKKVSTKELEEFIKGVQENAVKGKTQQPTSSEKDKVKEMLKDVSDVEMETFLSAIPMMDDEFTVTD
jgi:hypothetical protein